MATYYYDRNGGGTAGFGTLTGNFTGLTSGTNSWNNTGSGIGTISDWVAGNVASFGGTSNTAVGGTVTATGTISVTGFICQNLSTTTTQNINGTGTFAAGSSALTFDMRNELVFANTTSMTGTGGMTFLGTSTVYARIFSNLTGMSGTITQQPAASFVVIGPYQNNAQIFNSATTNTVVANGTSNPFLFYQNSANPGWNFTVNANLTGTGRVQQQNDIATQFTVTINGSMAALANYGIWLNGTTIAKDLPTTAIFYQPAATGTNTFTLNLPSGAATTSFATDLKIEAVDTGAGTYSSVFNSSDATAVTITGGIKRTSGNLLVDRVASFTLGGSNTGANTISGAAAVTSPAIVNFTKADAGKWVLSNNNSALASTTVTGGTLQLNTSSASVDGSITLNSSTVLELSNVGTVSNAFNNAAGTIRNVAGSNTLTGGVTLAGTSTFESQAGTLTISTSGVSGAQALTLSGAGDHTISSLMSLITSLTKSGAGTSLLSGTANNFPGTPTINAGTLEAKVLANSSANSSIGAGPAIAFGASSTGFLKYSGSALAATNRAITFGGGATAGFEAEGTQAYYSVAASGTVTLTNNNTVALKGSNTGFNTLSGLFSGAGTNGIAKTGTGRWILTGANNLTGASTVSAGTLMAANAAGATGSKLVGNTVTVSEGGKLQLGTENSQLGRCTYGTLSVGGTSGNPARIRIGGVATSPTIYLAGNLDLPSSGTTTWDLASNPLFKTPGTYTLVVFGTSFGVTGGNVASNVTLTGVPAGRSGLLAYNSPGGGVPNTITVTIS